MYSLRRAFLTVQTVMYPVQVEYAGCCPACAGTSVQPSNTGYGPPGTSGPAAPTGSPAAPTGGPAATTGGPAAPTGGSPNPTPPTPDSGPTSGPAAGPTSGPSDPSAPAAAPGATTPELTGSDGKATVTNDQLSERPCPHAPDLHSPACRLMLLANVLTTCCGHKRPSGPGCRLKSMCAWCTGTDDASKLYVGPAAKSTVLDPVQASCAWLRHRSQYVDSPHAGLRAQNPVHMQTGLTTNNVQTTAIAIASVRTVTQANAFVQATATAAVTGLCHNMHQLLHACIPDSFFKPCRP
jgi:hypothetical protein